MYSTADFHPKEAPGPSITATLYYNGGTHLSTLTLSLFSSKEFLTVSSPSKMLRTR